MSRKNSRIWVMKLLYQMEINKDYSQNEVEGFLEYNEIKEGDQGYFKRSVDSIIEHMEEIDSSISKFTSGWRLDRISKVDLAVLRIAFNEIMYFEDIPNSVAINEAVEVVKAYSNADSYKFVNGVLGSFVKSI